MDQLPPYPILVLNERLRIHMLPIRGRVAVGDNYDVVVTTHRRADRRYRHRSRWRSRLQTAGARSFYSGSPRVRRLDETGDHREGGQPQRGLPLNYPLSAQRLAVQLQGRRQAGAAILHDFTVAPLTVIQRHVRPLIATCCLAHQGIAGLLR